MSASTIQNTVFYIEDGKFYISRYVLIAFFKLIVKSQRPDQWANDLLMHRFERAMAYYPKENVGVFLPVFEKAKSVPIKDWVVTDNPFPRFESLYPQIAVPEETVTNTDKIDDDDENTLDSSVPSGFFGTQKKTSTQCWKQRPKFRFADFDIPVGSMLTYKKDPNVFVYTLDEKTGVVSDDCDPGSSWTDITRQLTGFSQVAPVDYWCYGGVALRKMYDAKYGNSRKKNKPDDAVPVMRLPTAKSVKPVRLAPKTVLPKPAKITALPIPITIQPVSRVAAPVIFSPIPTPKVKQ